MTQNNRQADIIKISAVLTAAPRWAGALMAADGVPVPPDWLGWWQIAAALLSVGMAAVEGFAISFVFNSWRNQQDKRSRLLLWLAILMLIDFSLILAPYVVANVSGSGLADVLGNSALLWLWSGAVAASTGLVVGSVGYAQKSSVAKRRSSDATSKAPAKPKPLACDVCGATANASGQPFTKHQQVSAHKRVHSNGRERVKEAISE